MSVCQAGNLHFRMKFFFTDEAGGDNEVIRLSITKIDIFRHEEILSYKLKNG